MTEDEAIKLITDTLKKNGIKIDLGGCGCCGSPWLTVEANGKRVETECVEIYMINK